MVSRARGGNASGSSETSDIETETTMKILVTGASGGVGYELTAQLAAAGHEVRAMSRRPPSGTVPGVESFVGDPADASVFRKALADVDGVFVNSVFLDSARTAEKVSRIVSEKATPRIALLSSLCTFTRRGDLAYADHLGGIVDAFRALNPRTVSVHPGQFATNVLNWRPMLKDGKVVHPFGDVRVPVIDPHDIAAVAKAGLTEDGHEGESLKISGVDSPSPREKVAIIAEATGRAIDFEESSEDEARTHLSRSMGPDLLDYYITMHGYPKPAEQEILPTVETLTGERPRTFRQWLTNNLAAFE
ncbi:NAD(P)H-binding protein [Streptomyces sp. NPDC047017]|uniref:SDR family oxidoreductase n=1 Tax=Streptomyces sp. NPDC047017 TaxID=3155024 RepID=UPI0034106816